MLLAYGGSSSSAALACHYLYGYYDLRAAVLHPISGTGCHAVYICAIAAIIIAIIAAILRIYIGGGIVAYGYI